MPISERIAAIAGRYGSGFRFPTNIELSLLCYTKLLGENATAGNLVHAMVLASGRGVTYNQVTLPLKNLGKAGLVSVHKVKSEASGRLVDLYSVTQHGLEMIDLADKAVDLLKAARENREPETTGKPVLATAKPKTPQELALQVLEGKVATQEPPPTQTKPSVPKGSSKRPRAAAKVSRRSPSKRGRKGG